MERLHADRLGEQVERLAHHAFRGEAWEKATTYLRQAGLRSMARAAYAEAVGHLEGALEALPHLPASRERSELAIDLRFELRTCLFPLGQTERMREHLREAEVLAAALGDQRRLGRVSNYMVIQSLFDSDYEAALSCGRRALDIAATLGEVSIAAPANAYLATAHINRGELVQAVGYLQRNVELLTGDLLHERFGQANIMATYSRSVLALPSQSSDDSPKPSPTPRRQCALPKMPANASRSPQRGSSWGWFTRREEIFPGQSPRSSVASSFHGPHNSRS